MDAVGTGRAAACRSDDAAPVGVYKPRRAQASPLFRLVNDQFRTQQMVYDERFAPMYGTRTSATTIAARSSDPSGLRYRRPGAGSPACHPPPFRTPSGGGDSTS